MSGAVARGSGWHRFRVRVHDVRRLVRPSDHADPVYVSYNGPCLRIRRFGAATKYIYVSALAPPSGCNRSLGIDAPRGPITEKSRLATIH